MSEEVTPVPVEGDDSSTKPAGKVIGRPFQKGHNAPGPGNPFAHYVQALRLTMFAEVGPEKFRKIVRAVAKKAEDGDVEAAKVIFDRMLGKPVALDVPVGEMIKMLIEGQKSDTAPQKRYLWATPPKELLEAPPEPPQPPDSGE